MFFSSEGAAFTAGNVVVFTPGGSTATAVAAAVIEYSHIHLLGFSYRVFLRQAAAHNQVVHHQMENFRQASTELGFRGAATGALLARQLSQA